jgi:hypothetical protein
MSRLKWKQYSLTLLESGEVRTLPATSDAIARDLARQRLAEDHWLVGDFSNQRESYEASEWTDGVVTVSRSGKQVATLRRGFSDPGKPTQKKR